MSDRPEHYIPELYNLKTYGKTYDDLTNIATETLFSFIKSQDRKKVILDINHADGDAVGSAINFAVLLEELNTPYSIDSNNSSSKLTFSTTRLPLNDIRTNLEKDVKLLFITTDNTPWYPFYSDLEEIIKYQKGRENLEVIVIDHHAYVGKGEVEKIRELEKENENFTYLNYGLSRDANVWWRRPAIPCAGEITFWISSEVLKKLNIYNLDLIKRFLNPTLLATYTDLRTHRFLESVTDEKIREIIKNFTNMGAIDEFQGFTTHYEEFINLTNGAIRVTGLKVRDEYDNYFLSETQRIYSPTHKLLKSIAAHVMLASKIHNPMILTRHPRDLGYNYDEYHLSEILQANKEWNKIKSIARDAFLYYSLNRYFLKKDRVSYFNDTKSVIAILPKSQTVVEYKGVNIDLSKLLKYAPYIEFFLTTYHPIAEMEIIKNSNILIVGIESSRGEGYSEFSFRSNSSSVPVGSFASEIANKIRKELNCPYHYVFGGGHETAAGLRIKQDVLDNLKASYNLDVYSLFNELIKSIRI